LHFTISGPQKKRKAQPVGEAAFAAACAIDFYVSLDAQKHITKKKFEIYFSNKENP
jgi:hypothetical protein